MEVGGAMKTRFTAKTQSSIQDAWKTLSGSDPSILPSGGVERAAQFLLLYFAEGSGHCPRISDLPFSCVFLQLLC